MSDRPARVVVTGLGCVTCLGQSVNDFWRGLCENRSGLSPISHFDATGLRNQVAGEVKDFTSSAPHDRAVQFALAAAQEAWADCGLGMRIAECGSGKVESPKSKVESERPRDRHEEDARRGGLVCSTNFGGADSWERYLASVRAGEADREAWAEFEFDRALAVIAEDLRLEGPRALLSLSCSSGAAAIGLAMDWIREGRADVMLAGGHDSLSYSSLAGLSILRTITAEQIRPFDKRRSGTIFGEGAAMVVLEELQHAQARGARIYAEVLGYAVNNNAYHLTAPDKGGEGLRRALQLALDNAGCKPEELDYINAHGTGTPYHDVAETIAIKRVLGEHAYRIPISSIKPAIGHIMGGAGTVEVIATVLAMRDGIVPPTLNYGEPDPECDLDYVPNEARHHRAQCAASISSGIGGNNAAVILRRWEQA